MSEENHKEINETTGNALQTASAITTETEAAEMEPAGPLTPEEFRSVLEQIDALGLTWSADIPPLIKPKIGDGRGILLSEEYGKIQQRYPSFPRELGLVMFYTLTGSEMAAALTGDRKEGFNRKAAAVRELLITPKYKGEFFFKFAIKVPYLVDVDWEIVIKAFERNVQEMPRIPYALLSLVFRQPTDPGLPITFETAGRETLTVAVNEHLIDILLSSLEDVKSGLQKAQKIATSLSAEKENNDGRDNSTKEMAES